MSFQFSFSASIYSQDQTSLFNEELPTFALETVKNIAGCAAAAALVANPVGIAGAVAFGALVHPAQMGVNWLGRFVFKDFDNYTDARGNQHLNNPQSIEQFQRLSWSATFEVLIQKMAVVAAVASVLFLAIKNAAAFGITEKTILTLAGTLTLPTAIALTASALVTSFVLNELYTALTK